MLEACFTIQDGWKCVVYERVGGTEYTFCFYLTYTKTSIGKRQIMSPISASLDLC